MSIPGNALPLLLALLPPGLCVAAELADRDLAAGQPFGLREGPPVRW